MPEVLLGNPTPRHPPASNENGAEPKDLHLASTKDLACVIPAFYENPATPTQLSSPLPSQSSQFGDASDGMSDSSSMPDQSKTGYNRRRSRSQLNTVSTPQVSRPSQPSARGYVLQPSQNSPDVQSPVNFQPPIHYQSGALPYNVGQHMIPAQPSLRLSHSPPTFGYTHTFHHPGVADRNMVPTNIHGSYQTMLQAPPAHVFQYRRHSPDQASTPNTLYPGLNTAMAYQHHQMNSSHSASSPLATSQNQNNSHSPSFIGAGQYHSLRYPSSMPSPQYTYQPQTFSTPPPLYTSQYATTAPYLQHFASPTDTDPQGIWWYMPHGAPMASSQQYDSGTTSYTGHYPVPYSSMGQHDTNGSYFAPIPSSSALGPYHANQAPHATTPSTENPPSPRSSANISGGAVNVESAVSSGSGRPGSSDRQIIRRSYHPNPPAHRSEWVMWAGNVPSDATHTELWNFFNQRQEDATSSEGQSTGVLSIFLISRSNCTFVNYEDEKNLLEAISRFNGNPMRPNDPRCPRLVCRVRRKDDDLKAGVGGQRGMGMHIRWVKDLKGKQHTLQEEPDFPPASPTSPVDSAFQAVSSVSLSSDEEGRQHEHPMHSSSSGSFTSSNSSLLARYFPQRYFILKSLTKEDLDISVASGLWATQKHNEGILDQAYRTSKDVFLIFSVNKSGEFYGYARMAGPVRRGKHTVSWASRRDMKSPTSPHSSSGFASPDGYGKKGTPKEAVFFSPSDGRLVDSSPLPVDGSNPLQDESRTPGPTVQLPQSAPAEMMHVHHNITLRTPPTKYSLDQLVKEATQRVHKMDGFELDPSAPIRAIRSKQSSAPTDGQSVSSLGVTPLQAVAEEEEKGNEDGVLDGQIGDGKDEVWGDCFQVEWLCTEKLPFYRTRHLRNPWNHDKEIKISRDGTELEPGIGHKLMEEWGRPADQHPPRSATTGKSAAKRGNPKYSTQGKEVKEGLS